MKSNFVLCAVPTVIATLLVTSGCQSLANGMDAVPASSSIDSAGTGSAGATGPTGPQGPSGLQGPAGPQGPTAPGSVGVLGLNLELDEVSGTLFKDTSGYGADATAPAGGISAGANGHSGQAVSFAGGQLVVPGTQLPASPQLWVEFWANPVTGSQQTTRTILARDGVFSFTTLQFQVTLNLTNSRGSCTVSTVAHGLPWNTWSHVAGWYDGLVLVVSVNGYPFAADCTVGPVAANPAADLRIGAADNAGAQPFLGLLDEVRIRTVAPASAPAGLRIFQVNNPGGEILTGTANWTTLSGLQLGLSITRANTQVDLTVTGTVSPNLGGMSSGLCGFRTRVDGQAAGDPNFGESVITCGVAGGPALTYCSWTLIKQVTLQPGYHVIDVQGTGYQSGGCVAGGASYAGNHLRAILN